MNDEYSKIGRNIVANYVGSAWGSIMGLVLLPLYIGFLGIEAFGLLGVLASTEALFGVLDLGLKTTLNRQLAVNTAGEGREQECHDLLRTFEIVYWLVAVVILLVVLGLVRPLGAHWLRASTLTHDTISQAFILLAIGMMIRWPRGLYSDGLLGLQQQVRLNVIDCGSATAGGLGCVIVLWLVSPTVQAFLVCQLLISVIDICVRRFILRRSLPHCDKPGRFDVALLFRRWRFSAGVFGITASALVLTQGDKILLSALTGLEVLGYYTLAWGLANALLKISAPFNAALFPRFAQLSLRSHLPELSNLYHRGCQLVSTLLVPAMVTLVLFSHEVLQIWTRDPSIAANAAPILSVLAIGAGLNAVMQLPYMLQLAQGWTSLGLVVNLVSAMLLAPLMLFLTSRFGAVGAATVWVVLNCGYVLLAVPIMHTRLLPGELRAWYAVDIALPAIGAVSTGLVGRIAFPGDPGYITTVICVILVFGCSVLTASVLAPYPRTFLASALAGCSRLFAKGTS